MNTNVTGTKWLPLAGLLCVIAIVVTAGSAVAGSTPLEVRRLAGPTRVETAIAIAREDFPHEEDGFTVVLARADVAADALASSWLAGSRSGAVLLTGPDELHAATRAQVDRMLRPGEDVFVIGGTEALSPAIEEAVSEYDVIRLAGADRFETSVAIAQQASGEPQIIVLADGTRHQDALIAGPVAMYENGVVLLTNGDRPHPAVDGYLAEHPDTPVVTIGAAATAAYPGHRNYVGASDEETAVLVLEGFGSSNSTFVGIARVDDFADGLAAAPQIARQIGFILLTDSETLSAAPADHLNRYGSIYRGAFLYGGEEALSPQVEAGVREANS